MPVELALDKRNSECHKVVTSANCLIEMQYCDLKLRGLKIPTNEAENVSERFLKGSKMKKKYL